jgi:hypothetical protein
MGILLFSTNGKECEDRMVRAISELSQRQNVEIYRKVSDLSKRFRRPRGDITVMILLTGNRKDLIGLLNAKDLFFDIPIILILVDYEQETTNLGFKMIPRFISYGDDNFEDVKGVLEKMIRQAERRLGNGVFKDSQ